MRFVRAGLLVLTAWMAGAPAVAEPAPMILPEATDLQALAAEARARNLPVLLMFSSEGCPYCIVVEEEFLVPMLISGEYEDKIIMRMIKRDRFGSIKDFDGQPTSVDALARRYRASLTPTLVFVDHRGRELAPRLIGLTTRDFYGGYLDNAIDQSLDALHAGLPRADS